MSKEYTSTVGYLMSCDSCQPTVNKLTFDAIDVPANGVKLFSIDLKLRLI